MSSSKIQFFSFRIALYIFCGSFVLFIVFSSLLRSNETRESGLNALLSSLVSSESSDATGSTGSSFDFVTSSFPLSGMIFVGHQSPDTDSIVSSIAAAALFGGIPARANRELNPETEFVLARFQLPAPMTYADVIASSASTAGVVLIDHNQVSQSPEKLDTKLVRAIFDHHAVQSGVTTSDVPILVDVRPAASTASIIADLYFERKKSLTPQIAGALLAGILSDTLAFQSPTTTAWDRNIANRLASISGEKDPLVLAKDMFKAKSESLNKLSEEALLKMDSKKFVFHGKSLQYAVVESTDISGLLNRRSSFIDAINEEKKKNSLDYFLFGLVDIVNLKTVLVLSSPEESTLATQAYGLKSENNLMELPGKVSRKKDLLPPVSSLLSTAV